MHVHFSVNISGWITVGLTQLLRAGPVEQINRVSKGLTEHKTLKKDFTFQGRKKFHTHTSLVVKTEKCMSMSCCGTGLKVSRDNIQIRHTHTHTHTYIHRQFILMLYNVCDSPNHQNARHLNVPPFQSRCKLFNTRQSSAPAKQLHPSATRWMFSSGPAL